MIDDHIPGAFLHLELLTWYRRHERPLPWRVLWQKFRDPWHIWVSEVMLQQTVIKAVLPVYERFLQQFPSPKALARAKTEDIRLAVRGLGYYRRFDLLHKACIKLDQDGVAMPQSHEGWLQLPGIGSYTAAAIASITGDEPQGVVDGNVERVLCRLLDIRSQPNLPQLKKMFQGFMNQLCALGSPGLLNQAVMELGQNICTPKSPSCDACPISKACKALQHKSQHLAPAQKSKTAMIPVEVELTIMRHDGKIILCQRPSDARFLKNTWGFLTKISDGQRVMVDGSPPQYRMNAHHGQKVGVIRHSITHHKITAQVMTLDCPNPSPASTRKLLDPHQVESNLVSNLDRKAWNLLQKLNLV